MRENQSIIKEIAQITSRLERNHPEVFRSLNENPMTVPSSGSTEMNQRILSDYLQSLKDMEARAGGLGE